MKKAKSLGILIGSIILIFFLALYFGSTTGYYETSTSNKATLTEDARKKFEKDVQSGKPIIVASTVGMKLSKTIEKIFNKGMSALFNEIDKAVRG